MRGTLQTDRIPASYMIFARGSCRLCKSLAVRNATFRVWIARAECLLNRNIPSVVDETFPFQSVSVQVYVLAILVQQRQDGPVVACNAPNAGKNNRQELFQFEAGTQFMADRDQA